VSDCAAATAPRAAGRNFLSCIADIQSLGRSEKERFGRLGTKGDSSYDWKIVAVKRIWNSSNEYLSY
jgi:hypothetical protein